MPVRYLTKSRFQLAVDCPTKLYFADRPSEYTNINREDSFLQMLADGGFQVGALAKLHYPDGIEITAKDPIAAERDTSEVLRRENVTLFEAGIRHGDLFVRIDILLKRNGTFDLIEVKSKSYDSTSPNIVGARGGIKSEMLPYIIDVAFQTHVLQSAYPEARVRSFLLMPDKSVKATVNGLNQLFKVKRRDGRADVQIDPRAYSEGYGDTVLALVNVDPYVRMVMHDGIDYPGEHGSLPDLATQWALAYKADTHIPPVIGAHCAHCEFRAEPDDKLKSGFHECWKRANNWSDSDFRGGTVLDLWNFRGKDKLIAKGVLKLEDVRQEDLNLKSADEGLSKSERQWLQVGGIPARSDKGGFFFDEGVMAANMSSWQYPFHLIDFETSAVALPFHKGLRPYEPLAFQFSHHIMESDGRVQHANEFLHAQPGRFPNYEFVHALKAALDNDKGSVFMWSHHENTILEKLVNQLEEDSNPPADMPYLRNFLRTLIKGGVRAMVDLKVLAQKAYFHPSTKGSNSIKKVLPAVLSHSSFLKRTYSQPVYGAPGGIPSLNYSNQVWWAEDSGGNVVDPYDVLKTLGTDLLGEEGRDQLAAEDIGISEGGAAALAYARLQFEDLTDQTRDQIKKALLRYCELDSLAMVMIVQAWKEVIEA